MSAIKRERLIQWDDPRNSLRDANAISGLDYLLSIKEGKISPPPIALLVGYKIFKIEKGFTVYSFDPKEYHYNPAASVHGGIISTILDTAMTASVISALEKGVGCLTTEMKVNFIRPITVESGTLYSEGRLVHFGKRLATSEGKLKDNKGNLCAIGIGSCIIFTTTKKENDEPSTHKVSDYNR